MRRAGRGRPVFRDLRAAGHDVPVVAMGAVGIATFTIAVVLGGIGANADDNDTLWSAVGAGVIERQPRRPMTVRIEPC